MSRILASNRYNPILNKAGLKEILKNVVGHLVEAEAGFKNHASGKE